MARAPVIAILLPFRLRARRGRSSSPCEAGGRLFDPEFRPACSHLVKTVAKLGVKPCVAALGAERLTVDEQRQDGRRRLKQVARRDDQIGALADLERTHLIGDPEDLRPASG